MNRRLFLASTTLLIASEVALSQTSMETAIEPCLPNLDSVSAEATYKQRYTHFHLLSIPIAALISPPKEGITIRTSRLDQPSLDVKAFDQFIKESGFSADRLRIHFHDVEFSQNDLIRIAGGEKNVEVIAYTKKPKIGHYFFFTASKSALNKIKRGTTT